ncbi:tannase and feruloyl esterase [Cryphonectria parasitica EP155]|uniref:Carboxylic ester hydrolase n=1 Tax=Cryphonectria parasitica (strain ATCC 38755 / EP155) TaxID=660469 RepID=A0A9P4YEV8_CRYP1|nr:tannase and feruloyl esterase [Cryphonectria parasitica EP155]KAF3771135.1 tannase and feruloyl esterase [Cryphonectria parasitica EP155]
MDASVLRQNDTGDFTTQCTAFADTLQSSLGNSNNATVWFTQPVAAGTNLSLPDYDPTCGDQWQVVAVDMCRVAMLVPTSDRSNISMEVWLPTSEAWTGRFLSTGNGGLSGCIQYYDLAYTVDLGFSTVATNNGHNGTSGEAFYDNDEVVEDFAWRALHTGVVFGKEVSQLFYGQEHNKSYYFGCSTGGRQGFKEAQDFPDDFDGWVVGAPALAFANLSSWSGSFFAEEGTTNASTFVPLDMWPVIHDDILDQCDGLDGYVDGIIEDAGICHYNVSDAILCSSSSAANASTACLTDVQANTVRKIFSPVINDEDGSLVFPAMQPGSELEAAYIYYTGSAFIYTSDWYRYAVYDDPTWNPATLSSADYTAASRQNPFNIQTWNGNLSAVQSKGSKILQYHGQQDPIITSYNSPRYYEHVSQTMGLNASQLDDFYRFFRISGMGHCSGGPGATFIGQGITSNATLDPEGNVLTAMVRWVEEGVAPDTILGTAYVNESQATGEVAFQRRHCRYPYRNEYSGSGDPTDPDSWNCV